MISKIVSDFWSVILITLAIFSQAESKSNSLHQIDWSNFTYDQLHEYAIQSQVENYKPLFKYLQPDYKFRSLNGLFKFCLDPSLKGFKEEWFSADLNERDCDKENFFRIPVPSAFNDITSNSEIKNYIGWVWYQNIFDVQKSESSRSLSIHFENVNYMAAVWIQDLDRNLVFLGAHVGGYLPFSFDIPEGSTFRLTIAVSNILTNDTIPSGKMIDLSKQVGRNYYMFQPDFDFFHFAGIMGDVMLTRQNHKFFIQDMEKMNYNGIVYTRYRVCFKDGAPNSRVLTEFRNRDDGSAVLLAGESSDGCFKIPDSPISLTPPDLDKLLSSTSVRFWAPPDDDYVELPMRFQVGYPNNTLLIEKKLLHKQPKPFSHYLQGFGMHHEQLFGGRTMSLSSIMKDLYLLKKIGANIIRTSHYPYSQEYLDACDELGINVIAECQAVGLESFSDLKLVLHKQLLREMMQRDDYHSSIIMWSVANEPRSDLPEAGRYFESLLKYAREDLAKFTVDSGRLMTAAIAQSHQDDKIGHTLDVIMVNRYYGWYDYTGVIEAIRLPLITSLGGWSQKYPSKGLILSEFGADTVSGLHSVTRGDIFTEEYQRDLLVEYEKVFDEIYTNYSDRINFMGSMIWNFADFSTHDSLLRVGGNRKGIFSKDRSPKLAVETIRGIYLNRLNKSCSCEISDGAMCDL